MVLGMAEGGAPQYDRRPGSVLSNEEVGKASYLIRVAAEDGKPVDYQPGHVLALEMQNPDNEEEDWLRGPYTVTRADDKSFDVMYRVVGKKTQSFSSAKAADKQFQFGGKFKVPIFEGIQNLDELDRVVLISTGVGLGPQMGFVEQALSSEEFVNHDIKIELYAGFRTADDVCCTATLNDLAEANPDHFSWEAIISEEVGRTSDEYTLSKIFRDDTEKSSTHFHLIGNGSMVNEFQAGLKKANVPDERITTEMYFNHKEQPRPEVVQAIVDAINKNKSNEISSKIIEKEEATTA